MNKLRDFGFKGLIVWQKAFQLCLKVYKFSEAFPKNEIYGLIQQIRRAAISIPSNIAEGYGRSSEKEHRQYLAIAYGSLCELETQYLLSISLKYAENNETINLLIKEVGSMLYRMINPKSSCSDSSISSILAPSS